MIKFLFVCTCVHTHSLVYLWTQRMVAGGQFTSFTTWVLGVKFRSSGLVTSTFHLGVLSAPKVHFQVSLYTRRRYLSSISNKTKLTEILCILRAVGVTLSHRVTEQQRLSNSEQAQRIWWLFYLDSVRQAPYVSVLCTLFWAPRKHGISKEECPQEEVISTHCPFVIFIVTLSIPSQTQNNVLVHLQVCLPSGFSS